MTRSLGIDAGTTLIRIAEIESHGKNRRLLGLYELSREEGVPVGQTLRNFFESSGLMGDRVGIGTGAQPLITRAFDFPFHQSKRVEAAVQAEFEDSLPFDISSHVLDIRPMGRTGKVYHFLGGLMAPDSLAELDRIGDDSGLILNAYFSDAEALAQLALNQSLPAAEHGSLYCVCDIGFATTKIALLQGENPKFLDRKSKRPFNGRVLETRMVGRGGRELIQWIRDKNMLSQEEALQWIIHRAEILTGDAGTAPAGTEISDEIKTALRPVVVELYQTLQSFKAKHGQMPAAVYLTGGLSGMRGLREFLTDELRTVFHPWPIFQGFDTTGVPLTMEKERAFAVALAIAHRWSYPAPGGWLNFKRMTAQKKMLSSIIATFAQPELRRISIGLAFAAVAAVGYNLASSFMLGRQAETVQTALEGEFRKLDRDLAKRAKNLGGSPELSQELFQQERKKRLAADAAKNGGPARNSRARSEIFLDVSEVLPVGVTLKEFVVSETAGQAPAFQSTYTPKEAPTPDQVSKSLEALKQSLQAKGYAEVALEIAKAAPNSLTLKAKWKGVPQ